ncbi:MAG: hypothetical protein VB119_04140 [Candidatus Metalachnospira sp.]|nr:hypothetical protein [Candidatus Metalachnospira sp.]
MFYIKEKFNDSMEVKIDITDENVFCRCPNCGCEVKVDLVDVLQDEESDLYGTAVFCDDCSKIIAKGGCRHGCK